MKSLISLKFFPAGLLAVCILFAGHGWAAPGSAARGGAVYAISDITLEKSGEDLRMVIKGRTNPTYTMYELFDPLRLVLDIADAKLSDPSLLPANLPQGPVQAIKHVTLPAQDSVVRLEIHLVGDPSYTIEKKGNNIVVEFSRTGGLPAQLIKAPAENEPAAPSAEVAAAKASLLEDVVIDTSKRGETRVVLKTNGPVVRYGKAELARSGKLPPRMYLDLEGLKLPVKKVAQAVGSSLARISAVQRNTAVRVTFDSGLKKLFPYAVESSADGLVVTITERKAQPSPGIVSLIPHDDKGIGNVLHLAEAALEFVPPSPEQAGELIVPRIPVLKPKAKPAKVMPAPAPSPVSSDASPKAEEGKGKAKADSFAFAGYGKQKITVDFYKIDLHNVFRLFGEISGQNIVIDEAVNGTLTLALNDVPWDFALDIVLNLKDLQKEERFNTIVISPKSKQFNWPKAAAESVSVKGSEKVEAISVKQRLETPKGVIEAKNLIEQAVTEEKKGRFEQAMSLYEKAFALWPDNVQLAGHLSTLCLAQAGMNAKAVRYAKAVLNADPGNAEAALQAAIGSANMKKVEAAKGYFDLAINGEAQASEALISYAAFAEEYQSYHGAMALLARHEELHGETIDTLVARARILDKLGQSAKAVAAYQAVLLSGYALPDDLVRFVKGRVSAGR